MGIPLKQLQAQIDSPTFALYMAYDNIEPIGNFRGDLQAGVISSTIATAMTSGSYSPSDFMPFYKEDKEPVKQSATDMWAIASQMNGRVKGVSN